MNNQCILTIFGQYRNVLNNSAYKLALGKFLEVCGDKLLVVDAMFDDFQCPLDWNIGEGRFNIKRGKFITMSEQIIRYGFDRISCVKSVL